MARRRKRKQTTAPISPVIDPYEEEGAPGPSDPTPLPPGDLLAEQAADLTGLIEQQEQAGWEKGVAGKAPGEKKAGGEPGLLATAGVAGLAAAVIAPVIAAAKAPNVGISDYLIAGGGAASGGEAAFGNSMLSAFNRLAGFKSRM